MVGSFVERVRDDCAAPHEDHQPSSFDFLGYENIVLSCEVESLA